MVTAAQEDRTLPAVSYGFTTASTAWEDWEVQHFDLDERLSDLYTCTVQVASLGPLELKSLVDASCSFRMVRGGVTRHIHGVINDVRQVGSTYDSGMVVMRVVPALWALSQRINAQVIQNKNAPALLEDMLTKELEQYGRGVESKLDTAQYPSREYTIQYRETDLDFVLRIMRDEGIGFYFDHEQAADVETLVLFDNSKSDGDRRDVLSFDGRSIPISGAGAQYGGESVRRLQAGRRARPTRVVMSDFDYTQPQVKLTREAPQQRGQAGGAARTREIYLANAGFTLSHFDEGRCTYLAEDGRRRAAVRLAAERARVELAAGASCVLNLAPGRVLTVDDGDLEVTEYLVVSVSHRGVNPENLAGAVSDRRGHDEQYGNEFECIPWATEYRPWQPDADKKMTGPQTATVVGAPNELVDTDLLGRVKIQFHWDRHGKRNENSSCWVRVVQPWAGMGFGASFLPRIGAEVLVQFIDGNPDRPVVIGCLYNGENKPPALFPVDKTRTVFKTQTLPASFTSLVDPSTGEPIPTPNPATGFNEVAFEDAEGREEIAVHAQRDLNVTVGNDLKSSVKEKCTVDVGNDTVVDIKGNLAVNAANDWYKFDEGVSVEGFLGAKGSFHAGVSESWFAGMAQNFFMGGAQNYVFGSQRTIIRPPSPRAMAEVVDALASAAGTALDALVIAASVPAWVFGAAGLGGLKKGIKGVAAKKKEWAAKVSFGRRNADQRGLYNDAVEKLNKSYGRLVGGSPSKKDWYANPDCLSYTENFGDEESILWGNKIEMALGGKKFSYSSGDEISVAEEESQVDSKVRTVVVGGGGDAKIAYIEIGAPGGKKGQNKEAKLQVDIHANDENFLLLRGKGGKSIAKMQNAKKNGIVLTKNSCVLETKDLKVKGKSVDFFNGVLKAKK